MVKQFFKKYDWIKIGGILVILGIDILIAIGIFSLFTACGEGCQIDIQLMYL